jgi:hypothetical protein
VRAKAFACFTSGPYAMSAQRAEKFIAQIDSIDQFDAVVKKLEKKVKFLRVLGAYKKGKFNS